jgi:hypothetical protein
VTDSISLGPAALDRYRMVCQALGGEPVSAAHKAVLARLSEWWDDNDVSAIDWMIRHRVGHAVQRCRSLLASLHRTYMAASMSWAVAAWPFVSSCPKVWHGD